MMAECCQKKCECIPCQHNTREESHVKRVLYCLMVFSFAANVAFAGEIVVTTSDYESANTAVYNTETGAFVAGALGQSDQDVVVKTDGKYIYFLSRSLGSLAKYDPKGVAGGDGLIWQYSVGPDTNPYDVVFLDSKTYVIRYNSNDILVVNQNADSQESFEIGTIPISGYDENGVPEAAHAFVYDGMVYVVMQRLNGWTADIPGYLIKIDPATDSIIDLNPETNSIDGIELLVKNPQFFAVNGATAYIGGHVWGVQTEGVQTVDLGDPDLAQAMILDEEALAMDVTGVEVFDNATGIFYSSSWVQEGDNWVQVGTAFWFDPQMGATGDALPVPTPEGGAVMVGDVLYVGSRDNSAPGVYLVDPVANTLAGDMLASTLPPLSMVYISDGNPTAVAEDVIPEAFVLETPSPNPFNPATMISFSIASAGMTRVDMFNVAGQKVDTLLNGHLSAGTHSLVWHAGDMANGVYMVRVQHGNMSKTAKVMLVK